MKKATKKAVKKVKNTDLGFEEPSFFKKAKKGVKKAVKRAKKALGK